jgi:electron transfer flavoprotein alpha subunit
MSKILVVAEHDGGKLNPSTPKCVTCASQIPGATVDVLVLAVDGAAVASQAAALSGVAKVLVANNPANDHALAAVLAPRSPRLPSPARTCLVRRPRSART